MRSCLKIFKLISGLKFNLVKSCLMGIHVENGYLLELANAIGCKVGTWPLKYLGMLLDEQSKSVTFWTLLWKIFLGKLHVGRDRIFH